MIVEPVPTNPRSPVRRLGRVLGLTLPVVLLVGVVAIGALGPPPVERRSESPSGDPSPIADEPTRAPALVVDGKAVTFPDAWIGLRVRSIADLRAERASGRAQGVVAVAGYLSYGSLSWACTDELLDVDRAACDGRTVFADQPLAVGGGAGASGRGSIGPHLHPEFPPGTRAPAPDDTPGSPRHEPIPVVVLGLFTDPPGLACPPDARDCGESFAVQRVVWVAGKPWGPTLTVDPALGVDPGIPEIARTVAAGTAALGRGALPLVTSVIRPDALGTLDADAAAALPPIQPAFRLRPVTYVRGLVFQFDASQPLYGRDPAIGWVVLDSITGRLLARGGPTGPGAATVGSTVGSGGSSTP
ncbi:MAG TPA: hypothetical protein VGK16_14695 [Candidatus Limnocylindrales bacterium]|jgi:hypothetical protein